MKWLVDKIVAQKERYLDFDEYIVASEPNKRERAKAWKVAIGLNAVDSLSVSDYLKQTARLHIEGEISIDESKEIIKQYYISKMKFRTNRCGSQYR